MLTEGSWSATGCCCRTVLSRCYGPFVDPNPIPKNAQARPPARPRQAGPKAPSPLLTALAQQSNNYSEQGGS
jgi:hypothetical protein